MFVATRYATQTRSSSNVLNSIRENGVYLLLRGIPMNKGHFYYIEDQYFIDFPDPKLMQNKETINEQARDRPCFYAFEDQNTGLYWMIPFSSQISKYRGYYNTKIQRYHHCDTITFGEVLGHEKAFLIQNMCPITSKYIKNEYIDSTANTPVRINGVFTRIIRESKTCSCTTKKRYQSHFSECSGY